MDDISNYFTLIAIWVPCFLSLSIIIWLVKMIKKNNEFIMFLIKKQNNELVSFKNSIMSQNEDNFSNIVQVIKDGGGTNIYLPHQHKNNTDKLFEVFGRIKQILSDDLYRTMMKTNACRVAVYLFHNGTKTAHGFSFLKISCVGDKCQIGSGIKERILNHSNMPINLFDDMYDKLIQHGHYTIVKDQESGIMETSKAEFLSGANIQYSQAVCIYDFNNVILGFILAEFDHTWDATMADLEKENIRALCKRLSPIFSYNDYVNLTIKDGKEPED